jgi:PIN domain nuclease of toxin-antitoxin system
MKKLLLDTHALIWWWLDDPQLSAAARLAINDTDGEVWVSAATAWEIMTKQRLGKLPELPPDLLLNYEALLRADGFKAMPISTAHALRAGSHPAAHRDPFDRMLAAQAAIEGAVMVSCDVALDQFGMQRLW